MRRFAAVALSILLASSLATAKGPAPGPTPDEGQLIEHGHYTNKAGQDVHSPAHTKDNKVPAGASAKCGDGSYSFSKSRSGSCSRHGGVAAWLK